MFHLCSCQLICSAFFIFIEILFQKDHIIAITVVILNLMDFICSYVAKQGFACYNARYTIFRATHQTLLDHVMDFYCCRIFGMHARKKGKDWKGSSVKRFQLLHIKITRNLQLQNRYKIAKRRKNHTNS